MIRFLAWLLGGSSETIEPYSGEQVYSSSHRVTGHCAEKGCGVAFDRAPGAINPDRCTRHSLKREGLALAKTTMPGQRNPQPRPTGARPVLVPRKERTKP